MEFAQIPARDLADHVVEGGLEEGAGALGDGVVEFVETVAQTELGCDKGERVACCFGGEGG